MSAFALQAPGRYRQAAAEWRYLTSWPEAHSDTMHHLARGGAPRKGSQLAAADADADGN
jgi:hypothetical protein